MRKKRLVLDVDGVLANFTETLLQAVESQLVLADVTIWQVFDLLTPDQRRAAFALLADPDWWHSLPVLLDGQMAFNILEPRFDVYYATSPWWSCVGWETARRAWLEEHFGATREQVVITTDKSILGGDVFIDDKPENVSGWQDANPGGQGFLLQATYNDGMAWDEILERLCV